jgi:hypothetical protein
MVVISPSVGGDGLAARPGALDPAHEGREARRRDSPARRLDDERAVRGGDRLRNAEPGVATERRQPRHFRPEGGAYGRGRRQSQREALAGAGHREDSVVLVLE